MAIESHYLRNKIKYHIARLKKGTLLTHEDIPDDKVDQYYSGIEIHVIEIAALTRKLRDLGKLPDNTLEGIQVNLIRYESKGPDSQRAYVDMEKEHDLDSPDEDQLPLSRIVDIVIHSYILQAIGDEDHAFTNFYVTSDNTRFKGLYSIELSKFNEACLKAANAYPSSIHAVYDMKAQKWIHSRL
jgi:hypothetical protein